MRRLRCYILALFEPREVTPIKKVAIIIAVLLLGAITIGCGSQIGQSAAAMATSGAPAKTDKPKKTKPAEPQATVSQKSAIASAEDYLSLQAFSRGGLIKQLSSEYGGGCSKADAVYAVNHIDVNWNEQAAKAAKDYLANQPFSRAVLIQHLESRYGDGYTHAQAVYGVNKAGL